MFPNGNGGGLGVGGWLFMIGLWVALLGVAMWAVARLFPSIGTAKELSDTAEAGASSGAVGCQLAVGQIAQTPINTRKLATTARHTRALIRRG